MIDDSEGVLTTQDFACRSHCYVISSLRGSRLLTVIEHYPMNLNHI